jgi:hypothetical protein
MDPVAFWCAEVGFHTWHVRVNNFPDDALYTLLIDGREVGDFDEWPPLWVRNGEAPKGSFAEPSSETVGASKKH